MWLTSLLLIVIFSVNLQGCSKSDSQSAGNDKEQSAKEESYFEAIVVCNSLINKRHFSYYNIAFKENGQYVTFDNDADYQNICQAIYFLQKAVNETKFLNHEFGYSDCEEWVDSPEHISLLKDLPEKVEIYLSGMKSEIQDKRILKMLDEVWYDYHPDRMDFYLSNDCYGGKEYKESGSGSTVVFKSNNKYDELKDLQGYDLPSEVLVAYGLY